MTETHRTLLPGIVWLFAAMLAACGGSEGRFEDRPENTSRDASKAGAGAGTTGSLSEMADSGNAASVLEAAFEDVPAREVEGLAVQEIATGLDTPWEVAFAPDGRVFFTERPGTVRVIENGRLREEPYAELDVREIGEGGQLGLALDPDFEKNEYLYAYYTAAGGPFSAPSNRIVRLVEDDGIAREEQVLLETPAASVHNGGRIAVGPDGKLWATLGDATERVAAQDLDVLAGKIVRIETGGSIPDDNPFPGSTVYSYGHRNPQGLAWNAEGNLYAPEHGQSAHDELNLIGPEANYGWPHLTGMGGEDRGFVDPVLESGEETWAPSGAAFVAGGPWAGSLLFTGLRGESLHRVVFDADDPARVTSHDEYLRGEYGRLRTVAQGPDGALYVLTSNRDGRGEPVPEDDRLLRIKVG